MDAATANPPKSPSTPLPPPSALFSQQPPPQHSEPKVPLDSLDPSQDEWRSVPRRADSLPETEVNAEAVLAQHMEEDKLRREGGQAA